MRLLFCATDAGGARNLLPVARLARENHDVRFLAGSATDVMVQDGGFAPRRPDFTDADGAARYLRSQPADAILLGTTGWPAAEAWLTIAAHGSSATLAVLDEWYNYRLRFSHGAHGLPHLPDLVCCQDELACREAAAEGLPPERLHITGGPALSALADTIEAMAKAPPPPPAIFADLPRPLILFLSETHAADYGRGPGESGRIGAHIGYTEMTVRALLGQRLRTAGRPASVVERLHPSDIADHHPPETGSQVVWHTNRERSPLWPSLWRADAVIGMRSMALLEAALMGHRPGALQPGLIGPDVCTAGRLGLADRLDDAEALDRWIARVLACDSGLRQPPRRPAFAATDAAFRVLALAEANA